MADLKALEDTRSVYTKVIDAVLQKTNERFTGTSQSYKSEFKQKWIRYMKQELVSYMNETSSIGQAPEVVPEAPSTAPVIEKLMPPPLKKVKAEKADGDDGDEGLSSGSELSDGDDDLDGLIKKDSDKSDPDNVIIGVTPGCKTNKGKWKGDIMNCVLKRKGHPETIYKKCSCTFELNKKK